MLFWQMRAGAQEQGARLHDFNSVVAVSVELENLAPARFGDPLRLRITLHNIGSAPIALVRTSRALPGPEDCQKPTRTLRSSPVYA